MLARTIIAGFATLVLLSISFGQIATPLDNPYVLRAKQFGETGLNGDLSLAESPLHYKSAKSGLFLEKYCKDISQGYEEEEKLIFRDFEQRFNWLEKTATKLDAANDGAFAFAYSLLYLHKIRAGVHVAERDFYNVSLQLHSAFAGIQGTDQQKREFYEWSLCTALTIRLFVGPPDQIVELQKEYAAGLMTTLTGAQPDAITFERGKLFIAPNKKKR